MAELAGDLVAEYVTALSRFLPVPLADRGRPIPVVEAAAWLGCPVEAVSAVVGAGLPVELDKEGAPLLEMADVANLGFAVSSGRSTGEIAERCLLRYATQRSDTYLGARHWTVRSVYRCGCGQDRAWTVAEPALHGAGRLHEMTVDDAEHAELRLRVSFEAVGTAQELRSALILEAYRDVLADLDGGPVRYQWLSDAQRSAPERTWAGGVADCLVAAERLVTFLRSAGVPGRTRTVSALAVTCVDHAWAEALDEDGEWKVLDPVFGLLGARRRHEASASESTFARSCAGLRTNRVLPWSSTAGEGVATHGCSRPQLCARIEAEGRRDVATIGA